MSGELCAGQAVRTRQASKIMSKAQSDVVQISYKPRTPINLTELVGRYSNSSVGVIFLNRKMYWSYIAYQFRGNEAIAVKELLRAHFHFVDSIVSSALLLAKDTLSGVVDNCKICHRLL